MKTCSVCGLNREESEFRLRKSTRSPSPDGLAYECRVCHAAASRRRRGGLRTLQWSIPEAQRPILEARIEALGLTPGQYVERLVRADIGENAQA